MKRIFTFYLLLTSLFSGKLIAQPSCIALGCASNYGSITANTSGPDVNDPNLGCYGPYNYKQVYWQYFYAPSGGNFTQTYHQTSIGAPINLNFVVFDMGTIAPSSFSCPIDASAWTESLCATTDRGSADVGPGLNGDILTTDAGHFYAIAIIVWDGTDPSYTFTIGTPQLGGVNLTAANCSAFPRSCIPLGCAANYGTINANTSGPDKNNPDLGCYGSYNYKQIYWQFFYAPTSDNFTQTYHQTSTGNPINLNFVIFDMGISAPPPITCPINVSGWTQALCAITDRGSADVGPGLNGDIFITDAGHFYAIAIILWDNTDPAYSFTIGDPQLGGSDLTSANCVNIALPVKLISFDAKINNCAVDLNWKAASEIDFKNYEVQYSTNGTDYKTIATISGNGSNQTYSYRHTSPPQGKIDYRLKMVDIDGKFEYSKTISLKVDCNNSEINVYPNPVTDILKINIRNTDGNTIIANLFDNNGKLIYSGKMVSGVSTINMAGFAKGIYLLRLKGNSEAQNIKIIK
jgi:Secretion system C-terminal sorting domain